MAASRDRGPWFTCALHARGHGAVLIAIKRGGSRGWNARADRAGRSRGPIARIDERLPPVGRIDLDQGPAKGEVLECQHPDDEQRGTR